MAESRPIKHKLNPAKVMPSDFKYVTICEVHRRLYNAITSFDIPEPERNVALGLVEEAFDLGKRMWKRLDEYKRGATDSEPDLTCESD